MAKEFFNVYETDEHNSRSSCIYRGTFTTRQEAILAIVSNHDIPRNELVKVRGDESEKELRERYYDARDALEYDLFISNQTQGYSVNYLIERTELNKWQ